MTNEQKNKFMARALELAKQAAERDEVPVGAVIVKNGEIIAESSNQKEEKNQATRHAEIVAIEKAETVLENWWLEDCDLFVTLEPCMMCSGAMILARIRKVYFGAYDKKTGAIESTLQLLDEKSNHKVLHEGGILEEECSEVLTEFFRQKRKNNRKLKSI